MKKKPLTNIRDLKFGDIVLFNDRDIGVVSKEGQTLIHEHRFIEITYLSKSMMGSSIHSFKIRIYGHHLVRGKKIGELKK